MKLILLMLLVLSSLFIQVLVSSPAFSKSQNENTASITELTITDKGNRMSGLIYQAAGKGPHPTILLLHGYPGNEKNLDVAQRIRKAGWNVMFFHYRGSWGSEGEFSFIHAEQDVQTALTYLKEHAERLKVDPTNISIVGHSMGGHMAMSGLFGDQDVQCAVSYDGLNIGANNKGMFEHENVSKVWMDYSDSLFMLNGWSGAKAKAEVLNNAKHLNLLNHVNKANGRPILLIAANTDVIPMEKHIMPLFTALKHQPDNRVEYLLMEDDHSFSSSRDLLIKHTKDFLEQHCRN